MELTATPRREVACTATPQPPRGTDPTATASRPIVVGSGLSGLWTAWRLARAGCACILLTKRTLTDSATAWAQGGIAAAVGPDDSPAQHAADTLVASDGLAEAPAVRVLTTEGPLRVRDLQALGVVFDHDSDGRLALALEGAHSRPRVLHWGGDRTGALLVQWLIQCIMSEPRIEIRQDTEVVELLRAGEHVVGVLALGPDGSAETLPASSVVLATGGVGQLYALTTNPLVATGDGWALAHAVGARLRHLEFLQFHPTALKLPGVNPAPLISEAVRGAGAVLVDAAGRRFLVALDPRAELAPRHVTARAVGVADRAGGAWLDARHVAAFAARFPKATAVLRSHGLDPARDLIPVAPAMHYAMGGITTDLSGRSSRPGLWAVGEVASTGVHGADRLASNSLLEGLVFGERVAWAIAAEPRSGKGSASASTRIFDARADESWEHVRRELRQVMTAYVGLERSALSLERARQTVAELSEWTPRAAWRTRHQLLVARLITDAARRRRESRGAHARVDYPGHHPAAETVE